jgi:hypothetical protein
VFVVRTDDPPFGLLGMGPLQQDSFFFGELTPEILGLQVDLTQFPLAEKEQRRFFSDQEFLCAKRKMTPLLPADGRE